MSGELDERYMDMILFSLLLRGFGILFDTGAPLLIVLLKS